ncbi:MAG: hypothetical protein JST83_16120 [Bacteroidetes bacterium]|nr:hypothetical protein [Bacteroidota bacterium]
MRELVKSLIAAGITMGLADRQKFVSQVSELITRYQNDPAEGDKWAERIVSYLEQTKSNINLENAIRAAIEGTYTPDKKDINTLTEAIEGLTRQMKQSDKSADQQ